MTKNGVTVVIPTIGRANLRNAVESAKKQDVDTKVIVVLDDLTKSDKTQELLDGLPHILLKTKGKQGGGVARNLGLHSATTPWVSYLDDDDEWEHGKLDAQLSAIAHSKNPDRTVSVTATRFVREDGSSRVFPRVPYRAEERIGDYLVKRSELFYGTTFMQTSSLLGPTTHMQRYSWDEALMKHQDWDLFVRLLGPSGGNVVYVPDVYVTVNQGSAASVSKKLNWRASADWFLKHQEDLGAKAAADFLFSQVLRGALSARDVDGFLFFFQNSTRTVPHTAALVVALAGLRQ